MHIELEPVRGGEAHTLAESRRKTGTRLVEATLHSGVGEARGHVVELVAPHEHVDIHERAQLGLFVVEVRARRPFEHADVEPAPAQHLAHHEQERLELQRRDHRRLVRHEQRLVLVVAQRQQPVIGAAEHDPGEPLVGETGEQRVPLVAVEIGRRRHRRRDGQPEGGERTGRVDRRRRHRERRAHVATRSSTRARRRVRRPIASTSAGGAPAAVARSARVAPRCAASITEAAERVEPQHTHVLIHGFGRDAHDHAGRDAPLQQTRIGAELLVGRCGLSAG